MRPIFIFLLFSNFLLAQVPDVVRQDLMNFEAGELIVKLKDNVDTEMYYKSNGKAMSDFNVAELLSVEEKVASSRLMFHKNSIEASIRNQQQAQARNIAQAAANPKNNYKPEVIRSMKNVFVLTTISKEENILGLVEQIKANSNVDYVEPNYIYSIDDFEVGEIISAEEAIESSSSSSTSTIEVNDPLYSSQSNITSTNIDDVWQEHTSGDGSQVIAILDTGGDYEHPDLEPNTWINEAELNGVEGYDDDGNGYIDDVRGWDFINNDNAPLDDNMHGTHVAGIAGAVGNNGIGIAGAAWDVQLMHLKVFQSTGVGNSTTIAEGVEYAANNGATILNMSFGSYAESSTLKLALENTYSTAILVAAAGNDKICIGPGLLCFPHYPAAYSFVLGVEDINGIYDNYDQDGPIASGYVNLLNYELQAPGSSIMSTVPNGGYATLTGTSMATPLVAGGLALYNTQNPDDSKEIIFGNLINTSSPSIDLLAAIEVEPTPQLAVISSVFRDSIDNQNGNDILEPGETVEILPLIKNYWGPTEDVRVGIEFAEFEDTSKATIVQNEIEIGSISAYASLQDLYETLKITISEGVANNVDIRFNLRAWSGPDQEYISEPTEIVVNVKNAILFSGFINVDTTLTMDKEYLIVSNVVVSENAVVTIQPGTILKFSDNTSISFQENSKLICEGTPENMIKLTAENNGWKGINLQSVSNVLGWHSLKFTEFSGIQNGNFLYQSEGFILEDVIIRDSYISGSILPFNENSIRGKRINIYNNVSSSWTANDYYTYYYGNLSYPEDNYIQDDDILFPYPNGYENEVFIIQSSYINYIGNHDYSGGGSDGDIFQHLNINEPSSNAPPAYYTWNAFGNSNSATSDFISLTGAHSGQNHIITPALYLGSLNENIIDSRSLHYLNSNIAYSVIDWSQVATVPFEENHGIVWKVLVNGLDAQDEYSLLDPIGVGMHEFKVYFNREMDTLISPQISYGVIMPYNQKIISEEGSWSEDGKIYTVNHDVNIGAADGINRIRVQGARDLDYFDIPVEDSRFNMLVQSAGSASTGFFAQGGLGKIELEWIAPSSESLDDVLGYNMYRYQLNEDGSEGALVKLNDILIIEDSDESTTGVYFTDFDVVQGETYFYKYKILRTSFEETDFSNTISASPLTSTLGDSNGDFEVNVLDLVHDMDYILGNNPEPFIFVAGDVNADNTINVLDIVGTVDIILNGDGGDISSNSTDINFYPSVSIGYADFSWEGNDLYVESAHNLGGLQLAFDSDFEYVLHDLPGVERLDYTQGESKVLMLYSFNNTSIASSKTKILSRLDSERDIDINLGVVGTTSGSRLTPRFKGNDLEDVESPFQSNNLEFLSLYPNPSNGLVTLEYYLPEQMDGAIVKVYDMMGRLVWGQIIENSEGIQQSSLDLNSLQKGSYIVVVSAGNQAGERYLNNKLLILK